MRLRRQQIKNFCCLLMLANGTPMFRAGDEFLQTQAGNGNPYNVDSGLTWLDWARLDAYLDVFRFFQKMLPSERAIRRWGVPGSGETTSSGTASAMTWIGLMNRVASLTVSMELPRMMTTSTFRSMRAGSRCHSLCRKARPKTGDVRLTRR